jgi:hypothetical protein
MEEHYEFIEDDKAPPDRYGRKRQKMVHSKVKSHGGWLFIIRGKPGHTIRLTSLDQLEGFGLGTTPKMIDANTGEEVDEHGVPKIVRRMLEMERTFGNMTGSHGTDIDVMSNAADEDLGTGLDEGGTAIDESVVDAAIEKLEA